MDRLAAPKLTVEKLSKSYPSARALDAITFETPSGGGILCILGPNGSGKTTLLRTLAGLVIPDSGTIRFDLGPGAVHHNPETALPFVGFSPSDGNSFYGRLTGRENLDFFGALRGLDPSLVRQRASQLNEPLSLAELLPVPHQLCSTGMKQRLSLARALLHEPSVLLLDEPCRSLDPASAEKARSYFKQLSQGDPKRLILWTTHQVDEAWSLASHVLILAEGKVKAYGTPGELLAAAKVSSPEETYFSLTSRENA